MAEKQIKPDGPGIFFSCTEKKSKDGEIFITQHVLDYIISGSGEAFFNGEHHTYKAGDFRFVRRNRISRFIKYPSETGEYQSITISIDQQTLLGFAHQSQISPVKSSDKGNVILLKPHQLLNSYLNSILPYIHYNEGFSPSLIKNKVEEAVIVLLETNPGLAEILFDFNDPGKIDLAAYMEKHYSYNGSLSEFAYQTGRSLSTFKRDFKRMFNTSPNKWLLKKRLEAARHLIQERGRKATDVYFEVGFKDYSHFSVAFKKQYGSSPSTSP